LEAHGLRVRPARARAVAGTLVALRRGMAAVMALVFLFVFASIGLMIKISVGALSISVILAMACFVALAAGVFVGAFLQVKHMEDDA
jgi:hypothetical protein